MKLQNTVNHKAETNLDNVTKFGIKESIKSFQILSSSLYSDPILAIIRELSTNAYDSHIAAGKPDTPIEIHFPSIYEPYFGVKDYGVGMDAETVETVFTVYFESTKNDNNDEVGGLGIGGKSPYSYTDNFTITSIKDGKKLMYTAFVDDGGLPNIAKLGEVDTTEQNGVDIQVPVKESDFYYFKNKASHVFAGFDVKPTFVGDNNIFGIVNFEKGENVYQNIYEYTASYYGYRGTYAKMGCILYPVDVDKIMQSFDDGNALTDFDKSCIKFLRNNFVIDAGVGDYDIQPSREGLTYTRENCQKIIDLVCKLGTQIHKNAVDDVTNNAKNPWEKISIIKEKYNKSIYQNVMNSIIDSLDLKEYVNVNGGGYLTGVQIFNRETVNDKSIEVYRFTGEVVSKDNPFSLNYFDDITFVFQTKPTGIVKRVREHARSRKDRDMHYCVIREEMEDAEIAEFLKELSMPLNVMRQDDLDKPVSKKREQTSDAKFAYNYSYTSMYGYTRNAKAGRDYDIIENYDDNTNLYYYMDSDETSDTCVIEKYTRNYQKNAIIKHLKDIGVNKVYVPRKAQLKKVRGLSNWVNINEYLKNHLKEEVFTKDRIIQLAISRKVNELEHFDDVSIMGYTISDFRGNIKVSQPTTFERALADFYNIDKHDDVMNKVNNEVLEYLNQYPLMPYLTFSAPKQKIKEYIKMVDNYNSKDNANTNMKETNQ